MDSILLYIMGERDRYVRFREFVNDIALSKEGKAIWDALKVYYKQKPAVSTVDWADFEAWFFTFKSGIINKDNITIYKAVLKNVADYKPDEHTSEVDVMARYITKATASELARVCLDAVTKDDGDLDDAAAILKRYDDELGRALKPDDVFATGAVDAVLDRALKPGLEFRLTELRRSCGPVRGGDHILIAAYVGTGKTTFCADQVAHMASQLTGTKKVVWVNNEERSDIVTLRIRQAALGKTIAEMNADRDACDAEYAALMGGDVNRIMVLKNNSSLMNTKSIESILSQVDVGMIVFDVLDKVEGFRHKDNKEHERLGNVYKWARELGHMYDCPVISVTQTDATGADTRYIGMDQLRGSKVDKPAEADVLIGIGKNKEVTADQTERYICVSKNKMPGGGMFEEECRLISWNVKIDAPRARYVGI